MDGQVRVGWFGGGGAGQGRSFIAIKIQCRFMSNSTNASTQCVTHEEKERERMGIELNEQKGNMNITQLVGFRCVEILQCFLCFFSSNFSLFVFVLSGR